MNLRMICCSSLPGVIVRAERTSNTLPELEAVPVPSTPLPTIDTAISWDSTPAWDPNSLTPRTGPEYDGTFVSCPSELRFTPTLALPGLPENWLDTQALFGKSVKVRIMVLQSTSGAVNTNPDAAFKQYNGKAASTMGEAVTGDPPAVRIKLMSSTAPEISIPLRYLHPIHPSGVKDRVIVIAGDLDNVGLEGVVIEARGETLSWYVRVSKDVSTGEASEGTGVRPNIIIAERQHLAVCGKVQVRV